VQPPNLHSINVLAIVCTKPRTRASTVYGSAKRFRSHHRLPTADHAFSADAGSPGSRRRNEFNVRTERWTNEEDCGVVAIIHCGNRTSAGH